MFTADMIVDILDKLGDKQKRDEIMGYTEGIDILLPFKATRMLQKMVEEAAGSGLSVAECIETMAMEIDTPQYIAGHRMAVNTTAEGGFKIYENFSPARLEECAAAHCIDLSIGGEDQGSDELHGLGNGRGAGGG